jgi:hypothetical protein
MKAEAEGKKAWGRNSMGKDEGGKVKSTTDKNGKLI